MKKHPLEPTTVTIQYLPIDFLKYNNDIELIETREKFIQYLNNHTIKTISGSMYAVYFVFKYQALYFNFSYEQMKALYNIFTGNYRHRFSGYDCIDSKALYSGELALSFVHDLALLSWDQLQAAMKPEFINDFEIDRFKELYMSEWQTLTDLFKNHKIPADLYIQFHTNWELLKENS
nr:hypothetical protein [uncultured Flavobacterium sp.]